MNKAKLQSVILFLYTWMCVAFPLGLWVLLAGPSKWLSEYARTSGMTLSHENLLGKLVILVYAGVSLLLAYFIFRILIKLINKQAFRGVIGFLGIIFLAAVLIFSLKPQWLISYSKSEASNLISGRTAGMEFVFGPFPDKAIMDSLKNQRFDGVISLLHEMVVPAEPALLKKETEYGEKIGLRVINIPMLPWISGNEDSVEKIKQLIAEGKGRYYVHCYLGRDRVNVFKSLIEKYGVETEVEKIGGVRKLEEIQQMERGKYYKLSPDIYLTPFPTDEEMFSYVLNGYFKTVVSLIDTTVAENQEWIGKEKKIMDEYKMKFIQYPVINLNEEEINGLLKVLDTQQKPILIHNFRTDDNVCEALIKAFQN